MKLGNQVLTKIQNIITQIDTKKKPRIKYPPQKQQQNIDINPLFNKLHDEHKVNIYRNAAKFQQKQLQQTKQLSPFKITNKHTIFINAQKQQPPIYQRIYQQQLKKRQNIQKLRQKFPSRQDIQRLQQQQIYKYQQQKLKYQKKYTQRQANDKIFQLIRKQKQRMERLNRLKIQVIDQHSKYFRCKPYVNQKSQKLWQKSKLKKQLSSSVFQRFHQYQMSRRYHLQQTQRQIKNKVMPFVPFISQTSRLLASRSKSRGQLHKPITRSTSCKCLQKSKPKAKHNISTAMHSSRNI